MAAARGGHSPHSGDWVFRCTPEDIAHRRLSTRTRRVGTDWFADAEFAERRVAILARGGIVIPEALRDGDLLAPNRSHAHDTVEQLGLTIHFNALRG